MNNLMNNTASLQEVLALLEDKAAGAVLPTLDNPAGADQVFAGYEVIDGSGAVVEGTFTIDAELSAQDTLIAQIQTALEGKVSVSAVLQDKTATPTEIPQEITADAGYDGLGKVTVEAIPSEYVVPSGTKNITENGTHDVKNYASVSVEVETGGAADPVLQDKTVNPQFSRQIITADEGYDGLGTVTVNGMDEDYIIPSGTETITENGKYNIEEYKYVQVNVEGSGGDTSIPSGYTRCDYIQFTGSQLVDTGIIGNQDTRIIASFTWESTTQQHLFGCASADNTKSITSYMNGSWRFGAKSATKQVSVKTVPYGVLMDKTKITLSASNTTISGVTDFETVGSLLLGSARSSNGSLPNTSIVGKVLYFYIWQAGVQVRKLVPVVSSEGVYRFYDLVSKEFFDSVTATPLEGGNYE